MTSPGFLKWRSVGLKVFAFYFLSMVLVIGVMGYLSYIRSADMMNSKIGGVARQSVEQTRKRLEMIVNEYENRAWLIFSNQEVQKQLLNHYADGVEKSEVTLRNNRFLSNLINANNDTVNIYLLSDQDTSYRYSPNNQFFVYNNFPNTYREEAWYKQIQEADGQTVYFGIRRSNIRYIADQDPDRPLFCFGKAIKNLANRNEIIGVMLYEVDPEQIRGILEELDFNHTGETFLIENEDSSVVADRMASGSAKPLQVSAQALSDRTGSFKQTVGGREELVVFDRFQDYPWTLVGLIRAEEYMKDSAEIGIFMTVIAAGFGAIAVALGFFVARQAHKPLYIMIRAMRKAREGDLNSLISHRRKDEFGILYTHFNAMVMELKEQINEVYVQKWLQKELQMKMLGSQINAHFLYNTLDSVHWIARIRKVDEISTMVFGLSRYLRLSLNEGRDEVSLSEIKELLESYLSIQMVRYRDKFTFSLEIEESLYEYRVLKYIFQPLIENAIYHGLEKKEGSGSLRVRFLRQEGLLCFEVEDDGAGIAEEELARLQEMLAQKETAGEHYFALRNISAQIHITYGPEYGLTIKSRPGAGTLVRMIIPLKK
ncbi:sensor histidine kinase [Paenibacillus gansuensis]|uniref:Sensor histidine kinase n=1 Tax=Paenibacillus gansuensis TaxID=306542 RepID=A0ABW5P7U0_9BACL